MRWKLVTSGHYVAEQSDIERAYVALVGKQERVERLFAYYDGTAGVPLVTQRLREVYQDQLCDLSENWSAVVIDSAADRITLEALEGPDKGTTESLQEVASEAELTIEGDDAHQQALIAGESFVIAWKGEDDDELECYAQHPAACEAFYDPARPNRMTSAAKWHDDGPYKIITLYYPDRIDIYQAERAKLSDLGDAAKAAKKFELTESGPNPYGVVPVFHFRPQRRRTRSDLHNIIPIQDAVNILVTNMIVGAEFGAFPLKYVMTDAELPKRLKASPNRIWELPADSKAGQFDAADLNHFITAIDHLVNALAIISRTPRHYFYGGRDAPSGEALRVMEAPLVKKCEDRIARFTPTWRQLAAFLHLLRTGEELSPRSITARFADPATVQPLHEAQARKTKAEAIQTETQVGLSKKRALMELGYSEKEAGDILAERGTETTELGNQLLTQFSRGEE